MEKQFFMVYAEGQGAPTYKHENEQAASKEAERLAEPLGFFINHEETGNILFATDTYYLPCKFAGLNNVLIECNYRLDLLDANIAAGRIPAVVRNRTLKSHLSYDHCVQALQANDIRGVNNIVLIHLSDGNSNAEQFRAGVRAATGKTVHIAEAGLIINFDKPPF